MMYYSKVTVDKYHKVLTNSTIKSLGYDGSLTINFLKSLGIGDNDDFCIYEDEDNGEIFINYTTSRLETDAEMNERVKKEEVYNKRYEEYHSKKK